MNNNRDSQKCQICETRKSRRSCVPAIVDAVEIDCSQNHRFCLNCIQVYSRIDSKCPLCASDYKHFSRVDNGETVDKKLPERSEQLSDEEKKLYTDYLDTISDLSSEEEPEASDDGKPENAERRIRNRIKQIKRLLHCDGVNCNSKDCLSGEHDEDCHEAIEEFHVGDFDWRHADTQQVTGPDKKLKREKTFEELLDECEQFVEIAIKEEEQ